MENAADALKIGFAMLIFITSLTLAFIGVTQAVEASGIVSRAMDRTELYPEHFYESMGVTPEILQVRRRHDNEPIMQITYERKK
jgi:hypothetical protein